MDDWMPDWALVEAAERLGADVKGLEEIIEARGIIRQSTALSHGATLLATVADTLRNFVINVREHLAPRGPDDRFGDWISTFTGKHFYPLDPRVEDVDYRDIAHGLSLRGRWGCQAPVLMSVGEHTLRAVNVVTALLRHVDVPARVVRFVPACVALHDSAESYLADVPRPVKRFLPGYKELENKSLDVIFSYFRLPPMAPEVAAIVKRADDIMLMVEADILFPNHDASWCHLPNIDIPADVREAALEPIVPDCLCDFGDAPRPGVEARLNEMLAAILASTEEEAPTPAPSASGKRSWMQEVASFKDVRTLPE